MKKILAGMLFLTAGTSFLWVWIAVSTTLAGSVERTEIGGNGLAYIREFVRYAAGPTFPAISLFFWGGIVALFIAVVLITRKR